MFPFFAEKWSVEFGGITITPQSLWPALLTADEEILFAVENSFVADCLIASNSSLASSSTGNPSSSVWNNQIKSC